jgi:hypothetical protein
MKYCINACKITRRCDKFSDQCSINLHVWEDIVSEITQNFMFYLTHCSKRDNHICLRKSWQILSPFITENCSAAQLFPRNRLGYSSATWTKAYCIIFRLCSRVKFLGSFVKYNLAPEIHLNIHYNLDKKISWVWLRLSK